MGIIKIVVGKNLSCWVRRIFSFLISKTDAPGSRSIPLPGAVCSKWEVGWGCASVQILGGVGWLCDGVGGGIGLLRMIS